MALRVTPMCMLLHILILFDNYPHGDIWTWVPMPSYRIRTGCGMMDKLVCCMQCGRGFTLCFRIHNTGYGVTLPGLTRISTSGTHTADLTHPTHSLRRTHAWQKYPSSDLQGYNNNTNYAGQDQRIKGLQVVPMLLVTCNLFVPLDLLLFLFSTRHALTTLKLDLAWIELNWVCSSSPEYLTHLADPCHNSSCTFTKPCTMLTYSLAQARRNPIPCPLSRLVKNHNGASIHTNSFVFPQSSNQSYATRVFCKGRS